MILRPPFTTTRQLVVGELKSSPSYEFQSFSFIITVLYFAKFSPAIPIRG